MLQQITCESYSLVYMISCQKTKCLLNYIGGSERTLNDRINEHRGYIGTKKHNQATGHQFAWP